MGKIGIFSLFSGVGFLDLGFEKISNCEILFVNEFHNPFLDAYKYSREIMGIDAPRYGYSSCSIADYLSLSENKQFIINIFSDSKFSFDLVGFIGGPPCPDFSVGGKNKGKQGDNGKLSETYIELICLLKPDFFVFENVKGLWRTKKHRVFYELLKLKLNESGYFLTERLINAIEYGVPQDRERIILIGFNSSIFCDSTYFLDKHFDWSKYIQYDINFIKSKSWPTVNKFKKDSFLEKPKDLIESLTVEHWFKQNNVDLHPNSEHYFKPRAGLCRFQTVMEGDDSKKSFKRLHRWRYSPTAAYGNNEVHLHPYKERRLTASEALAIQSLPPEFELPNYMSLSNMFKAIGNGVPFLASYGLAKTLIDSLTNSNIIQIKSNHNLCKDLPLVI